LTVESGRNSFGSAVFSGPPEWIPVRRLPTHLAPTITRSTGATQTASIHRRRCRGLQPCAPTIPTHRGCAAVSPDNCPTVKSWPHPRGNEQDGTKAERHPAAPSSPAGSRGRVDTVSSPCIFTGRRERAMTPFLLGGQHQSRTDRTRLVHASKAYDRPWHGQPENAAMAGEPRGDAPPI